MKNLALIVMILLVAGGAFFLHMKQVGELSGQVAAQRASLRELESRIKTLDARAKEDERALADDQKKLATESAAAQTMNAKIAQDLTMAQQALLVEQARKKSLQDQETALSSDRRNINDASLAGPLQNDQTRLAEIDRQLKAIDASEKDHKASNKNETQAYRQQMKSQESSLQQQIRDEKARIKGLQKQLVAKRKEKFNVDRTMQEQALQRTIETENASLTAMEASLHQLTVKEASDLQSNQYDQQQAGEYEKDQRAALVSERVRLQNELANLKSRSNLVKRDAADITNQLKSLRAQEHESDLKIQGLNQTIKRLQGELGQVGK